METLSSAIPAIGMIEAIAIARIAQVLSQMIWALPDDRSDRGVPNITHSCRDHHDFCHNVLKMAANNEFPLELFTAEVQIYDSLYNKFSKEYRDNYKTGRRSAASSVCLRRSRKQYKNTRTAYGRFLKRTSPSKSRKNDK